MKTFPKAPRSRLFTALIAALLFTFLFSLAAPPRVMGVSSSIVISQVYGGGGNSGATYKNDFIELFNRGNSTINVSGWSVQYASAGGTTWQVTTLSGSIAPGQYYLVQEAAGAGGTTNLPPPDATGSIAMNATSAKVALVNNSTTLSGSCPLPNANIVDLIGYGASASCSESSTTADLSNLNAAIRNCAGCADTDSNPADFTISAPTPRNTSATTNVCKGGCATNLSGVGAANPSIVPPGGSSRLIVTVTPASNPPSTGISVNGNLTLIGGPSSQQFFDDGTNGDLNPADNVFSYLVNVPSGASIGTKNLPVNIADAELRTATTSITLNVQTAGVCGGCGVERWSVKTGTDADAGLVNVSSPTITTLSTMRNWPYPGSIPANNRVSPYETTAWVVNATLTKYKLEDDSDVHLVLQEGSDPNITIVAELACSGCVGGSSPFAAMIANARNQFNARLVATTSFQTTSLHVVVKGVGMFDFPHGQTGAAPNQIELHPILDLVFCSFATSATSQYFSARGGEGSLNLTVPGGCNWSAASNAGWIEITSSGSGSASEVITYVVRENFTGSARQATMTIGDQVVTVVQDAGLDPGVCGFSISPVSNSFLASGGTGLINVTGSAQCAWQATSNVSWINITGNSVGIGSGAVMYTVAANSSGSSRRGVITVAGRAFSIKQK